MQTKPDITWQYFDLLRQSGEDATFSIHRFRGEKPLEKLCFDHRNYDGISAICEMARSLPEDSHFESPDLQLTPEPTPLIKFWRFLVWYAGLWPSLGRRWKKKQGLKIAANAYAHLTPEEWQHVQEYKGGTPAVLAALDQVSQNFCHNSWLPRLWMIPVGLYPKIDRSMEPLNRVSFVDVRLWGKTDRKRISQLLKRDLSQGIYWGSFLTLYVPKVIGERNFLALLKILPLFFRRTGTLTNLGSWKLATQPDEWWAVQTTVATLSPVAASMLEINGTLGIAIQFHPQLRFTPHDAREFMQQWKQALLS